MSSRLHPGLFVALLLLAGCYEHAGTDRVIDLRAKTAAVTLVDLRSDGDDPAEDLQSAANALLFDAGMEVRYPAAELRQKDFRARGEALDFTATFGFAAPQDVGVMPWDRGGHRICPSEAGMVISASNADARDEAGCVMWKRRATVLRVTETRTSPKAKTSLLPAFIAWDQAGRPRPEAEPPASQETGAPPQG